MQSGQPVSYIVVDRCMINVIVVRVVIVVVIVIIIIMLIMRNMAQ